MNPYMKHKWCPFTRGFLQIISLGICYCYPQYVCIIQAKVHIDSVSITEDHIMFLFNDSLSTLHQFAKGSSSYIILTNKSSMFSPEEVEF